MNIYTSIHVNRQRTMKEYTGTSAAAILTRPPEVVCVLKLEIPTSDSDVYAVFDPHPRQEHPLGSGLVFSGSLEKTALYLELLFKVDKRLLEDEDIQWQAQLLANFSAQVYLFNEVSNKIVSEEEMDEVLLGASLEMLKMKLEVENCRRRISNLEGENRRLENRYGEARTKVRELEGQLKRLQSGKQPEYRDRDYGQSEQTKGSALKYSENESVPRCHFSGDSTVEEVLYQSPRRSVPSTINNTSLSSSSSRQYSGASSSSFGSGSSTSQLFSSSSAKSTATSSKSPKNQDADLVDIMAAFNLQKQFNEEHIHLLSQFQNLKKEDVPIFECGICMESFKMDSVFEIDGCGHRYCGACLRGYVHSSLKGPPAVFPVRCPVCVAERKTGADGGGECHNLNLVAIT